MNLYITSSAYDDLERIDRQLSEFIGEVIADKVIDEIYSVILLALEQPEMGVRGIVHGTRELFPKLGKYRVVYQIVGDELHVLRIVLAKQQYP